MHGVPGKLLVALLLAICLGIHVLEVSGRWDQSFQDANDEAGIVAVVLCLGFAIAVAPRILQRLKPQGVRRSAIAPCARRSDQTDFTSAPPATVSILPLGPLRI